MPTIYLSPSTQEFNPYTGGGNEEQYMNLLADRMEPYLAASGIMFDRNTPEMTAASSIAASNRGNYDLHFALHSNASAGANAGNARGVEAYYFPSSAQGKRFADILVKNLKTIYPLPQQVRAIPTTTLGEVSRTRAPSVLLEVAYHDNPQDADFIRNNLDAIAQNLVLSLTEYFGIPFNTPQSVYPASVATRGSALNLRYQPSTSADIIGKIPNGAEVTVFADLGDWSLVQYGNQMGYVSNAYLQY